MKLRWLGPGILETVDGGKLRILFPGDTGEVDKARGEDLVAKGMATPHLLERVDVGYDSDHPRPSKGERAEVEALHQRSREMTQNIQREARLRPHLLDGKISPVPVLVDKEA